MEEQLARALLPPAHGVPSKAEVEERESLQKEVHPIMMRAWHAQHRLARLGMLGETAEQLECQLSEAETEKKHLELEDAEEKACRLEWSEDARELLGLRKPFVMQRRGAMDAERKLQVPTSPGCLKGLKFVYAPGRESSPTRPAIISTSPLRAQRQWHSGVAFAN